MPNQTKNHTSPLTLGSIRYETVRLRPYQLNAAICLVCNNLLISEHVHDFVACDCGNLAVDGGLEYLKRSWGGRGWRELSLETGEDVT